MGKSSTINHLFGLEEGEHVTFAKTSEDMSATKDTSEYVISADDPDAGLYKMGQTDR